jgi:membrane protease subunit HflK
VRRSLTIALIVGALYFASGLYIVRGNEQALVRRFGLARAPLAASGLHVDLPWPFTQIDRVNVNQVQTLAVGISPSEPFEVSGFLRAVDIDRQGEFLTGDKNILNLAISVQYRVSDPYMYLCRSESPATGLKLLVESLTTDAVSRSGVDYVHPLGLNELREWLTRHTREAAESQPWGIAVEDVTIAGAYPPVEVKAAFLEVTNARAEKDRTIHREQAQSEKRVAAAQAAATQRVDRARAEARTRVETARGSADRFLTVIAEFRREGSATGQSADVVRRRTMHRMFLAAVEQLLPRLAGKVLLDSGEPVDLTIFPPTEPPPRKPATDPAK